jgi:hypothetical protein
MQELSYFYLVCALFGGVLMLCQFLLGLLGIGGDHGTDAGHDFHDAGDHDFHDTGGHDGHDAGGHDGHGEQGHGHDTHHPGQSSWFVGVLSFRSIVAALTLFGLAGLSATENFNLGPLQSLSLAVAGGAAALFLVAYLMRSLYKLRAEGTVRMQRAVGQTGTVYVTIPGQKAGMGKVMLTLQNRTVECQAVTPDKQLPTGAKIVVTSVLSSDTVEVIPAP